MARSKKTKFVLTDSHAWMSRFTAGDFEEAFESRDKLQVDLEAKGKDARTAVVLDPNNDKKLAIMASVIDARVPDKFEGYRVIS